MSTTDSDTTQSSGLAIHTWDPQGALMECSENEIRFSRGFLRCKPEKWFPGLSAHWTPVCHAFDVDFVVKDITPSFTIPVEEGHFFESVLNGHPVIIFMEKNEAEVFFETLLPRSKSQARTLALDYFSRRLIGSLARSWSGRDEVKVVYRGATTSEARQKADAAVQIQLKLGSVDCHVWIFLSTAHIELLDGMWRRQTNSFQPLQGQGRLRVQMAELAVPEELLQDYSRSGAMIDLEIQENNTALLMKDGQKWCRIDLYRYQEFFAVSMRESFAAQRHSLPAGTVPVSIELGEYEGDPATLAEFSQPGAIMTTPLRLSPRIQMRVGDETLCRGALGVYQGRFAVTVD